MPQGREGRREKQVWTQMNAEKHRLAQGAEVSQNGRKQASLLLLSRQPTMWVA
jgi:hypothetical protein